MKMISTDMYHTVQDILLNRKGGLIALHTLCLYDKLISLLYLSIFPDYSWKHEIWINKASQS